MEHILIRNLPAGTKAALKARAEHHGRSVEAEARADISPTWTLTRPAFSGRVLPFGLPEARVLATYRVPEHTPLDDALIAATAEASGMTVVTRNIGHFKPLGVATLNPWN